MPKCDALVVIAHPDDEIFVSATICLCVQRGFSVTLVCVTDGGGGALVAAAGEPLGEIRKRELANSARALGVGEVACLGFADIADPACNGSGAWDQPRLIALLRATIEASGARLILTHGPLGGYGHPAHKLVYRCVMAAAGEASYAGSIFSFCGQVAGAFFSWHFDQPSTVRVDARAFQPRRIESLAAHRSQIDFFLQPYPPQTLRKQLSALFGGAFAWTQAGRKRIPIGAPARFFARFAVEGLVLQQAPMDRPTDFFHEHFADDDRVQFAP